MSQSQQDIFRVAAWVALGLAAGAALAQQAPSASSPAAAPPPVREIVQQRLPDGSVIFTDRPQPNARTERSWQVTPDDPAAEARRAAAQREAAEVIDRIGRQNEAERNRDLERQISADRLAAARAERDAAEAALARQRASDEAAATDTGVWWPRPPHARPPHVHPPQPGPGWVGDEVYRPLPVGTPAWRPPPQGVPSALPPRAPDRPVPGPRPGPTPRGPAEPPEPSR